MRKRITILLLTATLPLTGAARPRSSSVGDNTRCRSNPDVVAACFSLHGRMSLWEGSPSLRIWRIGTKRILGVLPSENPIVPAAIRERLAFGVEFYGNFEVCPFTARKPGSMQMVCVQRASNVVVQSWPAEGIGSPRITRLSGTYTVAPDDSIQRTPTRHAGGRR